MLFPDAFASAGGLSISFDFYAYGGTGGDGLGFFFADATQPPVIPGGSGGSLGYASRSRPNGTIEPGLVGGYLGIGFDAFGNYSNPTEGRVGGIGVRRDAIAIRGSAATGYQYLTGTQTLPVSLDNVGAGATRENSRRRAKVDLSPTGLLSIQVDLNNDADFLDDGEQVLNSFNVPAVNGALPANFRFGFTGSTGNSTNIHEVGDFIVTTFSGTPIVGGTTPDLIVSGGDSNDTTPSGSGNDQVNAGAGNDLVLGQAGNDNLLGNTGADTLIGGVGADGLTGGTEADRFVFSGRNKRAALRSSTLRSMDRITDFRFSEGDRFQLDFDNNLNTRERPKSLFNAGRTKGSLRKVLKQVYADKNAKSRRNQTLNADEAVFFRIGSRTYLSVNDNKSGFNLRNDLVAEVTGIEFRSGDLNRPGLPVGRYFA